MRTKTYRKILIIALAINIVVISLFLAYKINTQIPDNMMFLVNQEEKFNLKIPLSADIEVLDVGAININNKKIESNKININLNKPFTVGSIKKGKVNVSIKLFGLINLKKLQVEIIEEMEVIPSGKSVGIYIETNGILVLGTGKIIGEDGLNHEPAFNKIKSGDYILEINNKPVKSKYDLIKEINENGKKKVEIKYRRDNTILTSEIRPIKVSEDEYKIGIWVRDNTQGIGTLTFITPEGKFGALGHGITDIDTGVLMEIKDGNLYESEIISIVKGKDGEPGELVGVIKNNENNKIGIINKNNYQGIFGELTEKDYENKKSLKVGLKQDVKKGKAYIRTMIEGEEIDYEIEIESVDISNNKHNKGIVLKITDERLINLTGGIVQGMSGSPIIQDNKAIGAVTHVFVKDSVRGYGTFLEYMLNNIE